MAELSEELSQPKKRRKEVDDKRKVVLNQLGLEWWRNLFQCPEKSYSEMEREREQHKTFFWQPLQVHSWPPQQTKKQGANMFQTKGGEQRISNIWWLQKIYFVGRLCLYIANGQPLQPYQYSKICFRRSEGKSSGRLLFQGHVAPLREFTKAACCCWSGRRNTSPGSGHIKLKMKFIVVNFTTKWKKQEKGVIVGCTISMVLFMGIFQLLPQSIYPSKLCLPV